MPFDCMGPITSELSKLLLIEQGTNMGRWEMAFDRSNSTQTNSVLPLSVTWSSELLKGRYIQAANAKNYKDCNSLLHVISFEI
jgi:hypothetical protein